MPPPTDGPFRSCLGLMAPLHCWVQTATSEHACQAVSAAFCDPGSFCNFIPVENLYCMNFLHRENCSPMPFLPPNSKILAAILKGVDGKLQSEPLKEFKRTQENDPKSCNYVSKFWEVKEEGKPGACKGERSVEGWNDVTEFCCVLRSSGRKLSWVELMLHNTLFISEENWEVPWELMEIY